MKNMLEQTDSKNRPKDTIGALLRSDRRTWVYTFLFLLSVTLFVLSYIVPGDSYQSTNMGFFVTSVILALFSSMGLSHRIHEADARVHKDEAAFDRTRLTISADWSRMRSWPWFALGGITFALEYGYILMFPNSYYTGLITDLGLLFVVLGFMLLMLKFLSR